MTRIAVILCVVMTVLSGCASTLEEVNDTNEWAATLTREPDNEPYGYRIWAQGYRAGLAKRETND